MLFCDKIHNNLPTFPFQFLANATFNKHKAYAICLLAYEVWRFPRQLMIKNKTGRQIPASRNRCSGEKWKHKCFPKFPWDTENSQEAPIKIILTLNCKPTGEFLISGWNISISTYRFWSLKKSGLWRGFPTNSPW